MFSRPTSLIISLVCSFQITFGQLVYALERNEEFERVKITHFEDEIIQFKESIYGKEEKLPCEVENSQNIESQHQNTQISDEHIEEILADTSKNSCGEYIPNLENTALSESRESPIERPKECETKKIPGLIDMTVARILKSENEESDYSGLSKNDEQINSMYSWGLKLKNQLASILKATYIDDEIKKSALASYVQSVPLGMRDIIIVTRNYQSDEIDGKNYFNSLLPFIPLELFEEIENKNFDLNSSGRSSRSFENLMYGPKADYLLDVDYDSLTSEGRVKLIFNEAEMVVRRDVGTLLKALTSKNYMTALRMLTVFMMSKQIRNYEAMVGYSSFEDDRSIHLPKSCQTKRNGYLPSNLNIKFSEHAPTEKKIEDDMIYKILFSEGLIGSDEKPGDLDWYLPHPSHEARFIDNISLNPMEDGFSGNTFFENYKIAKKALKSRSQKIDIDDISQFDSVIAFKFSEIENLYKMRGFRGKKLTKSFDDFKTIQNFFDFPGNEKSMIIKDEVGEERIFYPFNLGINQYLANKMQAFGTVDLEKAIPPHIKTELSKSVIKIPFPSFYSPGPWRQFALKELARFAYENKSASKTSIEYKAVSQSCYDTFRDQAICNGDENHLISNLNKLIGHYRAEERYIPIRKLEGENIHKHWNTLGEIWNNLIKFSPHSLEAIYVDEYNFLLNQINAGNKWAVLKISYLLAQDDLYLIKNDFKPSYIQTVRGKRMDSKSKCTYGDINNELSRMEKFGKILKLEHKLYPFHANRVLKNNEKEMIAQNYIEERNEQIANLYDYHEYDKSLYQIFDELNHKTILSRDDLDNFVSNNTKDRLSNVAQNEIDKVEDLELSKRVNLFSEMYQKRDSLKEQYELFKQIEKDYNEYEDSVYLFKSDFLKLEDLLKTPVYKDLMRKAALFKVNETYKVLSDFCQADDSDHETLKSVFFSTTKIQNQMNRAMGVDSVPKELLDLVQSMPTAEKIDMALGIGAIALGISVVLLSAGTFGIGGLMAGYISVAARAALGMQLYLVPREAQRKLRADDFEAFVKDMEDLGLAEEDSADKVAVGWTWTAIEAISIIPLIGAVARGVKVGDKALKEAVKTTYKNKKKVDKITAKELAKQSGRTVALEEEILYAQYILGYRSAMTDLKSILFGKSSYELKEIAKNLPISQEQLKEIIKKINKLEDLHKNGLISGKTLAKKVESLIWPLQNQAKFGNQDIYRYMSKTSVRVETRDIYNRGAKTIADYFGGRPHALLNLLKSYDSKWFSRFSQMRLRTDKGILHISEYKNIPKKSRFEHIQDLLRQAQNGEVGKFKSWFRNFRYGHLNEVAPKITNLIKELEEVVRNNKNFDVFVHDHIKDLTTIFKKIPMRKRETAYMITLQGGPYLGVRAPVLSSLADGLILRKITNAISKLAEESLQREARERLGLNASVGVYSSMKAFEAFTNGVGAAIIHSESISTAKNLASKLHNFEDKIFTEVISKARQKLKAQGQFSKIKNLLFKNQENSYKKFLENDERYMKRILFSPSTVEEEVLSESLWKLGFNENMIWDKKLSTVALEALEQLKNYKTLDEYWDYMRVFRMVVGFHDRAMIELM